MGTLDEKRQTLGLLCARASVKLLVHAYACASEEEPNDAYVLRGFQRVMSTIPSWTDERVRAALHGWKGADHACAVLTALKVVYKDSSDADWGAWTWDVFRTCGASVARVVYKRPELFYDRIAASLYRTNMQAVEEVAAEAVAETLMQQFPDPSEDVQNDEATGDEQQEEQDEEDDEEEEDHDDDEDDDEEEEGDEGEDEEGDEGEDEEEEEGDEEEEEEGEEEEEEEEGDEGEDEEGEEEEEEEEEEDEEEEEEGDEEEEEEEGDEGEDEEGDDEEEEEEEEDEEEDEEDEGDEEEDEEDDGRYRMLLPSPLPEAECENVQEEDEQRPNTRIVTIKGAIHDQGCHQTSHKRETHALAPGHDSHGSHEEDGVRSVTIADPKALKHDRRMAKLKRKIKEHQAFAFF